MRWSRTRIAIGAVAAIVLVLLALNVTGIAPVPTGPLGDHEPAVSDVAVTTMGHDPAGTPVYLVPVVENAGPLSATVVRVTPTGVTVPGSVEVLGSLPFDEEASSEHGSDGMDLIVLGIALDPGPAWSTPQPVIGVTVEPRRTEHRQGRAFLVRVTPDPAQETTVLLFDVEYTIGPLHFLTTAWGALGTTLVMCPRDRPVAGDDGCVAQ